ncbi:MAG: response regulator transcription factor [Actinobacteria bacterium]|nr:response regulator transcription factor [Actinomycetota bacterium]
MSTILLAADADWLYEDIHATLAGRTTAVHRVHSGADVLPVVDAGPPELVILDLQTGNQGGMATCIELRLEQDMGRIPDFPVLMLLDRDDDVFLAKRAAADGWLIKPIDPIRLRRAVKALLGGGTYFQERRQVS